MRHRTAGCLMGSGAVLLMMSTILLFTLIYSNTVSGTGACKITNCSYSYINGFLSNITIELNYNNITYSRSLLYHSIDDRWLKSCKNDTINCSYHLDDIPNTLRLVPENTILTYTAVSILFIVSIVLMKSSLFVMYLSK